VRLSDYRGKKVVLIDFWATTCHPCLQEMPELVAIYHQYKDRGFEILAVATDDPDTRAQVSAEVRNKKMDFPVLLDDETTALDRYNPKGELPFAVLVDRRGSIVLRRASYQAGDEESMKSLRAAIEQALAAP
jgi:peroxiredoxin